MMTRVSIMTGRKRLKVKPSLYGGLEQGFQFTLPFLDANGKSQFGTGIVIDTSQALHDLRGHCLIICNGRSQRGHLVIIETQVMRQVTRYGRIG